ncbi:MAG: hypothetical protein K5663_04810 [Clostridiales bacterium]|nr:hypothetical protein [Clostridiales bacterium]
MLLTYKGYQDNRRSVSGRSYFDRSDKRSPYSEDGLTSHYEVRDERSINGFTVLSVVLLLLVFPVGLVLLWNRRSTVSVAAKLLLTFVGAVLFCMLLVYAANLKTTNPTVMRAQEGLNKAFDWVYEKTQGVWESIGSGLNDVKDAYLSSAVKIWDEVKIPVARTGIELLEPAAKNAAYLKTEVPRALLAAYIDMVGYKEPEKNHAPKVQNPSGLIVANTFTPEPTVVFASTTPMPSIPAITKIPTPTPTPEPIVLPAVKDVAEAPVYFTPGGTYYHLIRNCSGMMNAESHTLKEAKAAGKQVCGKCGVVSTAMLSRGTTDYLWVDTHNVAHTSDVCKGFEGTTYKIIPFKDVYEGHYTYCPKCKADSVYEYLRRQELGVRNEYEADTQTRLLHEYEKTITVYYGSNSKKYHSTQECGQMYDDRYVHTLYEALHTDAKKPCSICNPFSEGDALEELLGLQGK